MKADGSTKNIPCLGKDVLRSLGTSCLGKSGGAGPREIDLFKKSRRHQELRRKEGKGDVDESLRDGGKKDDKNGTKEGTPLPGSKKGGTGSDLQGD